MATPFLGELRCFSFGFAPRGWSTCAGQTLSIQQNTALFSLLGTTYGGNGQTNFMLPDLRGRAPLGPGTDRFGNNYTQGGVAGAENVLLNSGQIPSHTHTVQASTASPTVNTPAAANALAALVIYAPANGSLTPMNSAALGAVGSQPHNNMQPSLVLNYCIALTGVFPSRN